MDELLARQLPQSAEAEQAVIGSMLIDPECIPAVSYTHLLKKFDAAIVSGDKTAAEAAYKAAVKAVDKAAAKHLMHKNAASNKKSAMTLKLNAVG